MEVFSLQKVIEMLEEVVVSWQEVRWTWWTRQSFVAQFVQLLKWWLCNVWWSIVIEEIRPFLMTKASCRHCSFHCIQLISFRRRWTHFLNVMVSPGFRKLQWIRLATDHQTVTMIYVGASVALGSALELPFDPTTKLVFTSWGIKSTFPRMSQYDQENFCCCIE